MARSKTFAKMTNVCGAKETVVHVLVDCTRLSELHQTTKKIGRAFNDITDMLGGTGQGKEGKLKEATEYSNVLGAVLEFAETLKNRAPREPHRTAPGRLRQPARTTTQLSYTQS
jgi:hypothetical protein